MREREAEQKGEEGTTAMAMAMAMHLSSSSTPSSCCSALKPFVFAAQQQERAGPGPGPGPGPRELILSGSVRAIRPSEAAGLLQGGSGGGSGGGEEGGFRLLDVRPAWEREKARVGGSLHVPLFVADPDSGPLTLLKRWVHFGYVGLWTGQLLTTMNGRFVADVEALVPDKATKLLVACGEGLRSLIAVRLLHEGGYGNLAWLAGGFNRCVDGDFPEVEGSSKLQYATIGGVSYIFLQLLLLLQVIGNESKER